MSASREASEPPAPPSKTSDDRVDAHDVTITRHQVDPRDGALQAAGVIERLGLELHWTARRNPTGWDITLPSKPLPQGESWDLYDIVGEGPTPRARIAEALRDRSPQR